MKRSAWLLPALVLFGCESEVHVYESYAEPDTVIEAELGFAGDPANNALYAVDVSMWEGPIPQHAMDCLWDSNVRHVVAGTQVEEVTRQQLDMAVARGMTVDAYVYLYWDEDLATQVRRAFSRVTGFPLGRMWLDVEESVGGRSAQRMAELAQQAVDACRAQAPSGVECGLYTGPGYWKSYLGNTTRFADVPLWYAQYNDVTSLSSWRTEKFGGWVAPAAKQWAERVLCGIGLDRNTMQVRTTPTVVVDRTVPPRPTAVPPAPTGLAPSGVTRLEYLRLMADSIPWTTSWTFAVEHWNGTKWVTYASWSQAVPSRKIFPYWMNHLYRFKARATNAVGPGAWSDWTQVEVGAWTGARPGATPPPTQPPPPQPPPTQPPPTQPPPTQPPPTQPPPTQPPPTQPPPDVPGAPSGLSPSGATLTTPAVTLSCAPVTGATAYEFAIEYLVGGTWRSYYAYTPSAPRQTFYPAAKTSFRFTVRAKVNGAWTPSSAPASFEVR